jgi:Dolichyl-phosphate-mannose-protein mannosyltransferase
MDHGMTAPRPAEAYELATDPADWRSGAHRARQPRAWQFPRSWTAVALPALLAVQAVLTLRLLNADTAFQDEALYLWAGHRELAYLLHGTPLPPFAAFFSGAPVLYPPVGALADSIGGLAAARALSLLFMLGATTLLWASASRLFGRLAGFFAAGLFAVLGPVLHVGAFATYDAMSLFLVALATWCVIRAAERRDATAWLVAAGVVLALANATAYASTLLDPVVFCIAALAALGRHGGKAAAARAGLLLAVVAVLLGAGLLAGGSYYLNGVEKTTLARVAGTDSARLVLANSWSWTGIVVVLAGAGVIAGWRARVGAARLWLLALLACAAALVPIDQASLHTTASLNKHVAVGAWFAAIAAGYAVDRFVTAAPAGRTRAVTCGACVVALALPVTMGARQSLAFSTAWPNSSSFISILRPLADQTTGRLLVEDSSLAKYYLPAGAHWQRWSSTRNIVLPSGKSTAGPSEAAGIVGPGNAGLFAVFIQEGYFSLVALNFADTTALDHRIANDLRQNRHYHIIDVVPYDQGPVPGTYVIWRYEPHR